MIIISTTQATPLLLLLLATTTTTTPHLPHRILQQLQQNIVHVFRHISKMEVDPTM